MASVSGTILDINGDPIESLVRLHRLSDGRVASEGLSNPTTGAYSLTALDTTKHYTVRFNRPIVADDPNWSNVALFLPFYAPAGTPYYTDLRGHVPSNVVGAPVTTDNNGGGMVVTGGNYVEFSSADLAATTNWTLEAFIRPNAGDSYPDDAWIFYDGNVQFGIKTSKPCFATYGNYRVGTTTVPKEAWRHIALVNHAGTMKLFFAGALEYSQATSLSLGNTHKYLTDGQNRFKGQIKGFRYTKAALYTAAFTPPTFPLASFSLGTCTENAEIYDSVTPA